MISAKTQQVIDAAREMFFRYGYRRATMGDIAAAAGMSRPALYLVFASKEEVFEAVLNDVLSRQLTVIRAGLERHQTPLAQLLFACEIWVVQAWQLVHQSPDAQDLFESHFIQAHPITIQAKQGFETLVRDILEPLRATDPLLPGISAAAAARSMAAAMPGFKTAATSVDDLRGLIRNLVELLLAGFEAPAA